LAREKLVSFAVSAAETNPWLHNPLILWGGVAGLLTLGVLITLLCLRRSRGKTAAFIKDGMQIANIQGIGAREEQQDSFGVTDVRDVSKGVFAVVADGMGGIANGSQISRLATARMLSAFQALPHGDHDPAALLLGMVFEAQDKARAFIERQGNIMSGSTVVAVIIRNGELYFVSVGDSRICLLRGGALIVLNREHNCATYLDEQAARGEISLAEARNNPKRMALTSFIGLDGQLQIDSNTMPLQLMSGDRVILMSDGVFGTLTEDELVQAASMPSVQIAGAAVERMIRAKNRLNQDNFTAIIIET